MSYIDVGESPKVTTSKNVSTTLVATGTSQRYVEDFTSWDDGDSVKILVAESLMVASLMLVTFFLLFTTFTR